MSKSTMYDATSGQYYSFLHILTVRTSKECISCNLLWIWWYQLSCKRFKI